MTADLQPTLHGPTLRLRPLLPEDREALFAAAADPAIWALHPVPDRYTPDGFATYFSEAIASGGALVVIDRATGQVIGSSRFSEAYAEPGEVEIGWTFLARSHWGGSTNREMKSLMLGHAFRAFDSVMFRIGEHNLRSRRAVEKIGGVLSARTQMLEMPAGPVLYVFYTIAASAFAASPLAYAADC